MYCANSECPDFIEMGVPAEFQDGIQKCSVCDSWLEPGSPPQEPEAEQPSWQDQPTLRSMLAPADDQRLVEIASLDSPRTAHAAKGVLESEGIAAVLQGEHIVGQLAGAAPFLGGVGLLVPEEHADRAQEILEGLSEPEGSIEDVPELRRDSTDEEQYTSEPPSGPMEEWVGYVIVGFVFLLSLVILAAVMS